MGTAIRLFQPLIAVFIIIDFIRYLGRPLARGRPILSLCSCLYTRAWKTVCLPEGGRCYVTLPTTTPSVFISPSQWGDTLSWLGGKKPHVHYWRQRAIVHASAGPVLRQALVYILRFAILIQSSYVDDLRNTIWYRMAPVGALHFHHAYDLGSARYVMWFSRILLRSSCCSNTNGKMGVRRWSTAELLTAFYKIGSGRWCSNIPPPEAIPMMIIIPGLILWKKKRSIKCGRDGRNNQT